MANEADEPAALVERATALTTALADTRDTGQDPKSIGELLTGVLDALEARMEHGGEVSGLATGFEDLARQTCGLQAGDLIIVAGRPSMRKTPLAVNIAENVAIAGKVAFVVSLEISSGQLAERSVSRFGEIERRSCVPGV